MVLSAMPFFEGVPAQSSSQPKSSGSSRNLHAANGRPGPSNETSHTYQPSYDDREMALFHPHLCPWQIKKDEGCGKKYATLDYLYRHVLHAHIGPLEGSAASTSRKLSKLFACKWGSGTTTCIYAPKSFQDLKRHVERAHFDPYTLGCQYPDCRRGFFGDRRSRNEHHEKEHRSKKGGNSKHNGPEPEIRKRTRLVPAPMDEERWNRETFEEMLLALPDTSGLERQSGTRARNYFDPGVEVPFWVECLVPIGHSDQQRPSRAAKAREGSTSSQSSIGPAGHGARALTARTDQANVPQTVESDTSSSSDEAQEEDDDDVSIFITAPRRRSNPRSTLAFVASRSTPVLPQKRRPDQLARNPEMLLPHIPLTFQVASDPATIGPDGQKRYRRHPLLKIVDEAEDGEDDGDESDSSVQNNRRWLAGAKAAYVERGLTMELWRKEQRKLRRVLYPEHPDAGVDSDGDDNLRAEGAGARPESSSASLRASNADSIRSNPAVPVPQKRAPTLSDATSTALPDIPIRRPDSSRGPLPSIPKKVPVPTSVPHQSNTSHPPGAQSSKTGPVSQQHIKTGQSAHSHHTHPQPKPLSKPLGNVARPGFQEAQQNNRSRIASADGRQNPVPTAKDQAVRPSTGTGANHQPASSENKSTSDSRKAHNSGASKDGSSSKIFEEIGDLLAKAKSENEQMPRKRVVAAKHGLRDLGKSADDAIAISSGSDSEDDDSHRAKKPRISKSNAGVREQPAKVNGVPNGKVTVSAEMKQTVSPVRPSPALQQIKEVLNGTSSANLANGGSNADVWKKLQRVAPLHGPFLSSRQRQISHDSDEMDELEDSQPSPSDRRLSPSRSPQNSQPRSAQMHTPSRSNSVASSIHQQPEALEHTIPRARDVKMAPTRTPDRNGPARPHPAMVIDLTLDDSD